MMMRAGMAHNFDAELMTRDWRSMSEVQCKLLCVMHKCTVREIKTEECDCGCGWLVISMMSGGKRSSDVC